MLLVIMGAFYFGGVQLPFSMDFYSPSGVYLSPHQSQGLVYGRLVYENGTPAAGIEVRLFATDQLFEDYAMTNNDGYFISNVAFDAGQIIAISFQGHELQRRQEFVPYDMQDNYHFDLGSFIFHP